jgi:hypothetical protein
MAYLHIRVADELRDELKAEAKASGMFFEAYLISLIEKGRGKPQPTALAVESTALSTVNVEPEVQEVIDYFTEKIGKMQSLPSQRRATREMLKEPTIGPARLRGAIDAAAACRDEQYAPTISSLKQLQEKWITLENFYRRKQTKSALKGVKIR